MIDYSQLLHYCSIAFAVGVNSVGVGIGEGRASVAALKAINQQPSAQNAIGKVAIIGTALIETSAVLGLFTAIILFRNPLPETNALYVAIAEVGCALAIGLSGFIVGIVSSFPTEQSCYSIARQPFFSNKILNLTLLTQSIIQSPLIFSFLVLLFIKTQAATITTLADSVRYLSSGLCIGLGSIGPAIGLAIFAKNACKSIGINRHVYGKILTFSIISLAIIETPIIFALLISLVLAIISIPTTNMITTIAAMLAAGICMGLGTLFPGISSGKVASKACIQIAYRPDAHPIVSRVSMLAQGLIDTCAIYALLISLMIAILR
ncbi:hypothetical protein HN446_04535 [bacterium]|jgi:F-type H+-transporting ATPase subunit c|nr:hypothetical protein [bacterium]